MMHIMVYTTTSSLDEAKRIVKCLLDKNLAACINMHPISSVYKWEGKVEEDEEIALSIKTISANFDAVSEAIKSMHSYELPAIISWEIKGDKDYLDWITESTTKK